MPRIAVADPLSSRRSQLQNCFQEYIRQTGTDIALEFFDHADRLLLDYAPLYDVVFLALGRPEMDGMRAAKRLRSLDPDVVLVFVTNLERYAIQGYQVNALDFLLSPFTYSTFHYKLDRALSRAAMQTASCIYLQTQEGLRRLNIRDILYVETRNRMVYYHTTSGEIPLRSTMKEECRRLEDYPFAKCNQCYLVNLQHVNDVNNDIVTVAGNRLEISRRTRKGFLDAVISYIGGK